MLAWSPPVSWGWPHSVLRGTPGKEGQPSFQNRSWWLNPNGQMICLFYLSTYRIHTKLRQYYLICIKYCFQLWFSCCFFFFAASFGGEIKFTVIKFPASTQIGWVFQEEKGTSIFLWKNEKSFEKVPAKFESKTKITYYRFYLLSEWWASTGDRKECNRPRAKIS